MILLFCGLSGAGKTTLAESVQNRLTQAAIPVELIDADVYRRRLFTDLGYSREDRFENVRRLGFIASKFAAHRVVTIISAIAPYQQMRTELTTSYPDVRVVHIDCALDELRRRDTKGLYARAALPDYDNDRLTNLSGVNDPFEAPAAPDLYFNTESKSIDECTGQICDYLLRERAALYKKQA